MASAQVGPFTRLRSEARKFGGMPVELLDQNIRLTSGFVDRASNL
jgi:hypothetical protein